MSRYLYGPRRHAHPPSYNADPVFAARFHAIWRTIILQEIKNSPRTCAAPDHFQEELAERIIRAPENCSHREMHNETCGTAWAIVRLFRDELGWEG